MKSIRKRLSYANVMSSLAVFVVLGGGAIAASQLPKNSVGKKQLKNNAVTSAKIKKNAVTTPKIKNNSVTGAKINEGSLGSVPSATHSATSEQATSAVNATNAQNFSKFFASGLKKGSVGQNVTLLTIGPFTFTGKCIDAGSGEVEAITYLTTSQVGSSMYADGDSYYEADFNPGTEAEVGYSISDNSPYIAFEGYGGYYSAFQAASADGAFLLEGEAINAVFVYGSQCAWWVSATNAA